jgi:general secretion pathway protein F/type IV pilus assembly protein PilC
MAVSMVRAGGEGGFLEDALVRVADFTEKQEDLKSRTSGALAYPLILSTVGTIVVTVLIVFLVPKFEDVFEQLRQRGELPAITEWLLWLSSTLGNYGWLILIGVAALVVMIKRYVATEDGRERRDKWQIKLPLVGKIFLGLAVSRFCRILGTLLKNGVPILKSLEISSSGTGNRVLSAAVQDAAQNISEGQSLAKPLGASGHFPRNVVEMIAVAEESNNLDNVLTDISDNLDRQIWRQLDLMVRLIEPLILLILAGVVLAVVVALLLPIMKMSMTI